LEIHPLLPVRPLQPRPLSPGLKLEIRPPSPVEEVKVKAPQREPGLIRGRGRERNVEIARPYDIGNCIQIILLLVNANIIFKITYLVNY